MSVPEECLAELKEISSELGNDVVVREGCCPVCSELVSNSFLGLYSAHAHEAQKVELGEEGGVFVDIGDIE
jgi:hypothetical protein